MATVTRTTVWTDNQVLNASALNGEFNNLLNSLSLVNADISAGAAITEAKITFNGSGHGHTGGADGKAIVKNRAYGFFIAGTPSVANDLSWNPRVYVAQTGVRLSAHCKTAPTGADLILRVYNITQAATVTSVTITAGTTDATTTTITNPALTAGDILRIDVTQVGSTIAGSDTTIILDVTE